MLNRILAAGVMAASVLVAPVTAQAYAMTAGATECGTAGNATAAGAKVCEWRWWNDRYCRFCKRGGKWYRDYCRPRNVIID